VKRPVKTAPSRPQSRANCQPQYWA
jgi:hypothetical protein